MDNIDDMMGDLEEREKSSIPREEHRGEEIASFDEEARGGSMVQKKVFIGNVEHFYDKLNVVAIKLKGEVKVGDTIEIEEDNEIVKLKVSSMQIDRVNVESASEGDDVGIETDMKVSRGSKVYVIK